jgi:DNA-binding transcriptional LysR family regulator
MMDRHLLRYFLAVADTGSFSRAGDVCRVSQPTVSAGISRLEEAVGAPLFIRSNRRVELTAAGARLLPHARGIENSFLEAQMALEESPATPLIRLGVASTLRAGMVAQVIALARADGPIRLEVVERRPGELLALLDRARVDLVLGPIDAVADRPSVTLFDEPYLLAMAAGHGLAQETSVGADRLMDEPMLVRRHCEALPRISQFFTARGIRPFFAAKSMHEERIAAYLREGLGVTVMPQSLIGEGVVGVGLDGFDLRRRVGLVLEPGQHGRVARTGLIERIAAAF